MAASNLNSILCLIILFNLFLFNVFRCWSLDNICHRSLVVLFLLLGFLFSSCLLDVVSRVSILTLNFILLRFFSRLRLLALFRYNFLLLSCSHRLIINCNCSHRLSLLLKAIVNVLSIGWLLDVILLSTSVRW